VTEKISKAEANYVDYSATKQCQDCSMYRLARRCISVQGDISPRGHCKLWARASAAKRKTIAG
jgi:hypothetical protein